MNFNYVSFLGNTTYFFCVSYKRKIEVEGDQVMEKEDDEKGKL